jgi:serine/threonine protein kinase
MEFPDQLDTTVQTGSNQAVTKVKICPKCGMERLPTTSVCPADGTILRDNEPAADSPLSTLSETYEFIGETGRGGMAVIYKAKNRKTGRLVAIKKMLASSLTETAFLRFQQEAKAITSLRHPNIIMVHEFGVAEDGEPFMVMDFIEGSNLGDLIKSKGSLSVDESMHRFIQLCDALQHAHAAGVLHRDLKPGNVMLSSADGSFADARLVDFGIAKLMAKEGEEAEKLTMTGQLFGSPPYMSPEQCRGFGLDARTDIYSMGCVMFEALTGRVPIRGQSVLETIMMQVSEPAPSMKEVCPEKEFPPILENIIAKALAKDPNDRYQTMRELMVALMEAGIEMRSPGTIQTTVVAPPRQSLLPPSAYIAIISIIVSAFAIFGWQKEDALNKKNELLKASEKERDRLLQWTPHNELTDVRLGQLLQTDLHRYELDLTDAEQLTDSAMWKLTILQNLQKVVLVRTKIGDEGLKALVTLPRLHRLDLTQTNITNEGVKTLLAVKQLHVLSVAQTRVKNEGLALIGKMRYLNNLSIGYLPWVNEKGIEELRNLHLRWLFMPGLSLGDSLRSISKMRSLGLLDLHGSFLNDEKLSQLKDMVWLQSLDISGTAVTSAGMHHLSNIANLRCLKAGNLSIDDSAIDPLVNLPRLFELDLNTTSITDKGVVKLAAIKSLQHLNLAATRIGDQAVAALATLPNLKKLDLQGTDVSGIGLEKLKACKTLNELRISSCPKISIAAIEKFDRDFNHLDDQQEALKVSESDADVKRVLKIDIKSNSRSW